MIIQIQEFVFPKSSLYLAQKVSKSTSNNFILEFLRTSCQELVKISEKNLEFSSKLTEGTIKIFQMTHR